MRRPSPSLRLQVRLDGGRALLIGFPAARPGAAGLTVGTRRAAGERGSGQTFMTATGYVANEFLHWTEDVPIALRSVVEVRVTGAGRVSRPARRWSETSAPATSPAGLRVLLARARRNLDHSLRELAKYRRDPPGYEEPPAPPWKGAAPMALQLAVNDEAPLVVGCPGHGFAYVQLEVEGRQRAQRA